MIELFTANTPNGKKISIMLEEIEFDYKVTKINIYKDEQFKPEFKKISPFSKTPVIIDHDNKRSLFESGAILIYLAEKSGKFYDLQERTTINQWLMGQMGYVGPMLGQHHQFHHYNPGQSDFGEKRYFKISKRIYKELDERLMVSKFLAGKEYTIATQNVQPKSFEKVGGKLKDEARKRAGYDKLRTDRLSKETDPFSREQIKKSFGGKK